MYNEKDIPSTCCLVAKGNGLIPNFVTFGILIDLFRKVGGTLAARSCFAQMLKFGEVPNSYGLEHGFFPL